MRRVAEGVFVLVCVAPALVRLDAMVRGMFVAAMICVVATQIGCGAAYYSVSINAAQSRLEQAKQVGAETAAPYEYYYARAHLREAQVQASEASYGDAATFAETAETYAQRAIDLTASSKRGEEQK